MTHSQLSAIASELKKKNRKERKKNKKGRKVLIKIFSVCVLLLFMGLYKSN